MTTAVQSQPRATQPPPRPALRQLATHSHLYDARPTPTATGRTRRDAPDAIVVPTSRPASQMNRLIDLSADLGTELVVLCSGQANVEQVAERMRRRIGARGVVARVDGASSLRMPSFETSDREVFDSVHGGRTSDLSLKRNVGLYLARLRGWHKIVFVDDDMTIGATDVSRITHLLDRSPIAGMRSLDYPDNSVVCHARRLAQLPQSVFVSGSVLGVHCDDPGLAFFPDVYNEDWFFFGDAAASRRMPKPGVSVQAPYDPYEKVDRAQHEEFGDLLAEGLYALIQSSGLGSFRHVVQFASARYWTDFIEVRQEGIAESRSRLVGFLDRESCDEDTIHSAIRSLDAAVERYTDKMIKPEDCSRFLESWSRDVDVWRRKLPTPKRISTPADAMDELLIRDWLPVP